MFPNMILIWWFVRLYRTVQSSKLAEFTFFANSVVLLPNYIHLHLFVTNFTFYMLQDITELPLTMLHN